ncbi:hypothetical protein CAP48_00455 [Advenella sp. S44]|nr:hypothetical protein CAP48_00455 [Advenella sp. S44]
MGLTACGYKAPLYIPTPEQKQKLQEREARIEARKAKAAAEKKAKRDAVSDVNAAADHPVHHADSNAVP